MVTSPLARWIKAADRIREESRMLMDYFSRGENDSET